MDSRTSVPMAESWSSCSRQLPMTPPQRLLHIVEEGRLAAGLTKELILGAQHFALGRRVGHAERRRHFEDLAALHDAKHERQAAAIRHPAEQTVKRFERF